jgi:hypothetical protein
VTSDEFRALALNLDGVVERSHQAHPDFRVHGKIFATLDWPDASWGMVKLDSSDQKKFVEAQPDAFVPVKGKWGEQGCTSVCLKAAKADVVKHALQRAWQNSAAGASRKRK